MAKDVKCSVDNCKYYCDGCCEANCIHVGNCHCVEAKKLLKLLVIHLNVVSKRDEKRYDYGNVMIPFFMTSSR